MKAERLWLSIHPTLLVLLGVSLAVSWSHAARRDWLLFALGGYAVVIASTAVRCAARSSWRLPFLSCAP